MKCKWCAGTALRKQGHIWLCKKHYRFQQMRVRAKRFNSFVPTYQQLQEMLPADMKCVGCARRMVWLSSEDASRVLSLQHDRSGGVRFLCRACNTRHAARVGDSFYKLSIGEKFCPGCNAALPLSAFSTDNSGRWKNRNTYCRECRTARHAAWVSENRSRENAKRRAYYHARKKSGNPIPR